MTMMEYVRASCIELLPACRRVWHTTRLGIYIATGQHTSFVWLGSDGASANALIPVWAAFVDCLACGNEENVAEALDMFGRLTCVDRVKHARAPC